MEDLVYALYSIWVYVGFATPSPPPPEELDDVALEGGFWALLPRWQRLRPDLR